MANKNPLSKYPSYSQRGKKGVNILLLVLLCVFLARVYFGYFYKPEIEVYSTAEFDSIVALLKNHELTDDAKKDSIVTEAELSYLMNFDPNKVTAEELTALGFNKFQTSNLIKYREKGGRFYKNSDLKKVYGLTESEYKKYEPYIIIEKSKPKIPEVHEEPVTEIEKEPKDLNVMYSSELMQLGISSELAFRILKYKDLLGGYYEYRQLFQVYGMDSATFAKVKANCVINPSAVQKIDLNKVDYKELLKHPYIDKFNTDAIFKYKKIKGKIHSVDELVLNQVISNELFDSLIYYVDIQ